MTRPGRHAASIDALPDAVAALMDVQPDDPHCEHLGMGFDTCVLHDGEFPTAGEAWRSIRDDGVDTDLFGYGANVGQWFVRVHLARDCRSPGGHEVSAWNGRHKAMDRRPIRSSIEGMACDAFSDWILTVEPEGHSGPVVPEPVLFWMDVDQR